VGVRALTMQLSLLIGARIAAEEQLCREALSKRLGESLSLLLDGRRPSRHR
jgi:hypothetical protein